MNTTYLFDNAAEREASQRMAALSALHDETTFRTIRERGIAAGGRCLEVGGGNGSVARWMADQVGPSGQVVVTDIEPRFMERSINAATIEVRRHDIVSDPLPEGTFDVAHARLVLLWLPDRLMALDRMIAATKPGGWIVLEEYDGLLADDTVITTDREAARVFSRARSAQFSLMDARGADMTWGRRVFTVFRAKGLEKVGMVGNIDVRTGGSAGADLMKANFAQIRAEAAARGLITEAEMDRAIAALDDPGFEFLSPVMFTAWGRKPGSL